MTKAFRVILVDYSKHGLNTTIKVMVFDDVVDRR